MGAPPRSGSKITPGMATLAQWGQCYCQVDWSTPMGSPASATCSTLTTWEASVDRPWFSRSARPTGVRPWLAQSCSYRDQMVYHRCESGLESVSHSPANPLRLHTHL